MYIAMRLPSWLWILNELKMYVVFSRYMYFLFGSLFLKNFGLSSHICSAADKTSIMLSFVAALTAAAGPSWTSSSSCSTRWFRLQNKKPCTSNRNPGLQTATGERGTPLPCRWGISKSQKIPLRGYYSRAGYSRASKGGLKGQNIYVCSIEWTTHHCRVFAE
jgi:hypothetical protein